MQKQPRKFEISKMQSITEEAQAVETKESATETQKPMKFDDLKSTKAVLESVLRTKDSRDTKVRTADKVPLFTEKNELFIKGEKPSKDVIINFDEDDLDEDFESGKGKLLQERQHEAMAESVRIWVRHYISDKDNTESVVSKILEGKDKETFGKGVAACSPLLTFFRFFARLTLYFARWCNGSTKDSGSFCRGSNPCRAARGRWSGDLCGVNP